MKRIIKILSIAFFAIILTSSSLLSGVASAAFNKNRLIDDYVFNRSSSMTAGQINSFLNSFDHSCISPESGFEARVPSGYSPSGGFTYGDYGSAGLVILKAAQVYGLNPQVLIVTLEKEQSLVTGRNSSTYCSPSNDSNHKYAAAVGYGCPDSGTTHSYSGISLYRRNGTTQTHVGSTCVNSKIKAGFSQQLIRAAWLFKFGQQRSLGNVDWAVVDGSWDNSDDLGSSYSGPMTQGNHKRCGACSTQYYDGYTTIDGSATHMDSGATAALYWYTPHIHGNQVFVSLFTSWFGSTQHAVNYRLIECDDEKFLIERYRPAKRAISDIAIRELGLEDALFVPDDSGCDYPQYTLGLNTVAQSRQSHNKYFLNNGTFFNIQSESIAKAWGLDDAYMATSDNTPALDGTTINDFSVNKLLPRLAQSSNTKKVYLLDAGKIYWIAGTPSNTTNLDLVRGYDEVPMATFSADYLGEIQDGAGQGDNINAAFKVGENWYLFDHGKTRRLSVEFVADRWAELEGLLDGPELTSAVPNVIGNAAEIGKGFERDGTYYVVRVGGVLDSTSSKSMAKFWGIDDDPTITHLLKGVIFSHEE